MRIVNLDTPSGWRIASLEGDLVVDLNRAAQFALSGKKLPRPYEREASDRELPADLRAWLSLGVSEAIARAGRTAEFGLALVRQHGSAWTAAHQLAYPLADVPLAPPVAPHANVLAIGLNYRSHAVEAKMELPKFPLVFSKPPSSLNGPREPVAIPKASHRIDYEGEIVIVIGRHCREVSVAEGLDCVVGYTLANDLSARDWQFRTSEMMIGKAFDGFCPIGPCLVTRDDIPDPAALTIETKVNGDVRQSAPASDMIFAVADLVSYISQVMTLEPGDAILTGTPSGIGATRDPRLWLKSGDRVEVTASPIGTLTTVLVAST
jgi:2-keto-4-pentenoate hydratase/2-oxohepta-3-ene-1,7-dioic acid hydratase in catechol pathway